MELLKSKTKIGGVTTHFSGTIKFKFGKLKTSQDWLIGINCFKTFTFQHDTNLSTYCWRNLVSVFRNSLDREPDSHTLRVTNWVCKALFFTNWSQLSTWIFAELFLYISYSITWNNFFKYQSKCHMPHINIQILASAINSRLAGISLLQTPREYRKQLNPRQK